MNTFTIKEAEVFTGIKAHTLRIWELRYEMKLSTQKDSRYRMYSTNEIKFLIRISYLIRTGFKISHISKLNNQEVANLTVHFNKEVPRLDTYYNRILESILSIDDLTFKLILREMKDEYNVEIIIQEVLIPVSLHLQKVHLSSKRNPLLLKIANQWISEFICYSTEYLPKQYHNNMHLFLLFTPENQHIETNLLGINYMLRKNFIQTIYLGTNISFSIVKEMMSTFPQASICFDMGIINYSSTFRNYIDSLVGLVKDGKVFYTATEKLGFYANLPKSAFEFRNVDDILFKNESETANL